MRLPAVHPFLMSLLRGTRADCDPESLDEWVWGPILRDAAQHGLTPILYRWLKTSASGSEIPSSVLDRMKDSVFALAARNLVLAQELASILQALEGCGVACMPVRGLALAEHLYGDITGRPMGDLDLLVHKEDLPRVAEILRGLGFGQMDHRKGFAEAFSYTLVFLKNRHGWVIVEPHWTIAYPPFVERVDMQGVWGRAVRGRVAGVDTRLLSREDLLLHLCLHLAHPDGNAPLLWFYELDRLVRQDLEAFDWSQFCSIAREAQLGFFLSEILRAVKAYFDTPLPGQVLDQLSREPPRLSERRLMRLLAGTSGVNGREELAVFLTLKGFRARLRYALGLLLPSPQFMMIQSGSTRRTQLGLAYLRRVCRLVWEGSRGMAKLLR